MVDYSALLYDPVYAEIGVPAVFAGGTVGEVALTVIDDTRPKTAVAGSLEVRSVGPGAFARIPELTDNGIVRDDYVDATLTFNGRIWTVRSYELRGSPNGEDLGEVRFLLKDGQVVPEPEPEPEPDFPNASNTGVQDGITLTPRGDWDINASGTYENMDVSGYVYINANNVTLRNCRVTAVPGQTGSVVAVATGKTGVTIEYCDIDGAQIVGLKGIWLDVAQATIVRHCDISHCEDGVFMYGDGHYVHDNYIHDLDAGGVDPHPDGIQVGSGTGLVFEHNTIIGVANGNACLALGSFDGALEVTADNNLLRPGPAMLYLITIGDGATNSTVYHITNNSMEEGNVVSGQGYVTWNVNPPTTWTGNVDADTGAAIPAP